MAARCRGSLRWNGDSLRHHPAFAASAASAGATLSDLIVQSLTRHSSSEAFVAGDRRLTYAQVRDLVSRYMGALSRPGVGLGVGVTMLSPNTSESWIVQAATYLLGGRFTGLQALASVRDQVSGAPRRWRSCGAGGGRRGVA